MYLHACIYQTRYIYSLWHKKEVRVRRQSVTVTNLQFVIRINIGGIIYLLHFFFKKLRNRRCRTSLSFAIRLLIVFVFIFPNLITSWFISPLKCCSTLVSCYFEIFFYFSIWSWFCTLEKMLLNIKKLSWHSIYGKTFKRCSLDIKCCGGEKKVPFCINILEVPFLKLPLKNNCSKTITIVL